MKKVIAIAALLVFGAAALTAAEPALVVVEKISGHLGFYTATGALVKEVKLGEHPHEMIFSPGGKLVYISDNGILWMTDPGAGGNTISIVDVARQERVGVIDLGEYRRPHGLDIDPKTGRMVSTIENPDGMVLIDLPSRKVLRKYDVQGADPHMVLFGPKAEYAYVSNTASGTLAAVHLESGEVKLIPVGARPQGGVRSHDGKHIYLTVSDANGIAIVDTEVRERVGFIPTGRGPNRIQLTPDGETLVYSMQTDQAVGFADVADRRQTHVIPLSGPPLSLNMTADGRLAYAGIQEQGKVVIISVPERRIVHSFWTPKNAGPDPVLPIPGVAQFSSAKE